MISILTVLKWNGQHVKVSSTIKCILQRSDSRVSVFDVIVCPPSDPFPIKRHQHLFPVDDLKELEGVLKIKKHELIIFSYRRN